MECFSYSSVAEIRRTWRIGKNWHFSLPIQTLGSFWCLGDVSWRWHQISSQTGIRRPSPCHSSSRHLDPPSCDRVSKFPTGMPIKVTSLKVPFPKVTQASWDQIPAPGLRGCVTTSQSWKLSRFLVPLHKVGIPLKNGQRVWIDTSPKKRYM